MLGQPLEGELNPRSVIISYDRAADRCHHERISELGEREHELLQAQLAKFDIARDALLELTV